MITLQEWFDLGLYPREDTYQTFLDNKGDVISVKRFRSYEQPNRFVLLRISGHQGRYFLTGLGRFHSMVEAERVALTLRLSR